MLSVGNYIEINDLNWPLPLPDLTHLNFLDLNWSFLLTGSSVWVMWLLIPCCEVYHLKQIQGLWLHQSFAHQKKSNKFAFAQWLFLKLTNEQVSVDPWKCIRSGNGLDLVDTIVAVNLPHPGHDLPSTPSSSPLCLGHLTQPKSSPAPFHCLYSLTCTCGHPQSIDTRTYLLNIGGSIQAINTVLTWI